MNRIRKHLGATALVVCAFAGWSLPASAALLSSATEIAFFGIFQPTGGTNLADSSGGTFPSPVTIAAGVNDFAFAVGGNATFLDITFNPLTTGDILTFANGGLFSATEMVIDLQSETSLDLTLQGIWSLNGFDDTEGQLVLTADALGGLYTFSAAGTVFSNVISPDIEIAVIPVPAAAWLFASALAGLGITKRRRAAR